MIDLRTQFLSKEIQEVINALIGIAQKLIHGLDNAVCFNCKTIFKQNKTSKKTNFIFIVITDYRNVDDEVFKFCCLKCCKTSDNVMDVIELYPTLSLHSVKKLMYSGVIKKFFFKFNDSTIVQYKKYVIVESSNSVLQQILGDKKYNEEIIKIRIVRNETEIVAEDNINSLRVDYGEKYNFDSPLMLNKKVLEDVNNRCKTDRYYLEVYYKEYEKYAPFAINYNRLYQNECLYCVNKICAETGNPIFDCSICGPTNPNYFLKAQNDDSLLAIKLLLQQTVLEKTQPKRLYVCQHNVI
ncbi:DNA synthesis regulator [Choristoneura fumiferana granulovirus]|uniref:DNA synthesis regulator n=1 Tax=Choristoneura fumiferana granulovirus TaxID=56947 RepID=Q9YWK9_GVCF|nr:DNA synthesis regulator [Choristoneura fumiferana granulovirus]